MEPDGTRPWRREGLSRRIAPFFAAASIGVVVAASPPDPERAGLVALAAVITVLTLIASALLIPWDRVPVWFEPIPPLAYLGVVFVLRQGTLGPRSLYEPLILLPLFWFALYGTRLQLASGFGLAAAVYFFPALEGDFHALDYKAGLISFAVWPVICFTVQELVRRVRGRSTTLEKLVGTDSLTGVSNRRELELALARELARAERENRDLCVAIVDLDHFKEFNDTYGHQAGDELLKSAAQAWTDQLRANDLLARYGGDEFAIVLTDCPLERAEEILGRLRRATPQGLGCSAGVASWKKGEQASNLISRADQALYAAKRGGRGRAITLDLREQQTERQVTLP